MDRDVRCGPGRRRRTDQQGVDAVQHLSYHNQCREHTLPHLEHPLSCGDRLSGEQSAPVGSSGALQGRVRSYFGNPL